MRKRAIELHGAVRRTSPHRGWRSATSLVGLLLLVSAAPRAAATPNTVTFVVTAPASTPRGSTLWISGDRAELGAWNGAGLELESVGEGVWMGTVELPAGTHIEYKVTRGGWETVEKGARGGEIANRAWTASGAADTLHITVEAWRDQTASVASRASTITGVVRRHPRFESAFVPRRDVLVWLPPDYEKNAERRYPVLYFHDGQNVFDGATSFLPGQEWQADETAARLIREGRIPPVIMVAVSNTARRADEYTSSADARHGGGESAAYFRFLVEELKPFIDRTYRTMKDPAHTGVIGSSLGGLAALDLGFSHPDRFGLIGCISPAVWWADQAIVKRVRRAKKRALRIWLDIGTAEGTASAGTRDWLDHARALRDALIERGWREGEDLHYEEIEGAPHNERAWAARLDRIMVYLLAEPNSPSRERKER